MMVIVLQSWGEGLWRDGVRDVEVYAHVHVCEGAMIRHPFCPNTGMVASWGFRILVDHLGKEVNASLHRDCAEIGVRERGGGDGTGSVPRIWITNHVHVQVRYGAIGHVYPGFATGVWCARAPRSKDGDVAAWCRVQGCLLSRKMVMRVVRQRAKPSR